jgi:hypothetical protein
MEDKTMPNWCSNCIEISGSKEDIKKFKDAMSGRSPMYNEYIMDTIEDGTDFDEIKRSHYASPPDNTNSIQEFSLNALAPVPDDILRFPYDSTRASMVRKELGVKDDVGGYTWQINNWGCKWDVDPDVEVGEDYILLDFQSPWGPPLEAVEKMSLLFPSMSFIISYDEPGCETHGRDTYCEGIHVEHEELSPMCSNCGDREDDGCDCVRCVHCDETEDWCDCSEEDNEKEGEE